MHSFNDMLGTRFLVDALALARRSDMRPLVGPKVEGLRHLLRASISRRHICWLSMSKTRSSHNVSNFGEDAGHMQT